jgi:hypothetical protein
MAEENKIPLEIEVKGSEESIESFKDLKAAIKAAKDEQIKAASVYGESSKEYQKATKKIADLKDKVDDLNDSTKSLKGSGVEKVTESFSQLGEGISNLDTDKIKAGFRGIGAAMSAIPIFLLLEGLKYLVENFDEVSAAFKRFFNTASDAEKNIKNLEKAANDLKETNSLLVSSLENEVKILEASGASQTKILELKKQIIAQKIKEYELDIQIQKAKIQEIYANDSLTESYFKLAAATQRNLGNEKEAQLLERVAAKEKAERAKEYIDKLRGDLVTIQNLKTEQTVIDITENKKQLDDYKKHLEEKKQKDKEYYDLLKTEQARLADIENAAIDKEEARLKKEKLDRASHLEELRQLKIAADNKENADNEANLLKRAEDEKKIEAAKFQLAKDSLQATQQLTDLYFMFKSQKAKKGSKEEEDLARKQFNINKGLQLGLAVIDGFKSINASLAQSPIAVGVVPNPVGIASLAFASITAATNIAKIAAAKFQSSGGSGGGETPSTSTPSIPAPPTISTQQNNLNQSTQFDSNGKRIGSENNQPMKITATIGVDEITKKTDRVDTLEKQSTF